MKIKKDCFQIYQSVYLQQKTLTMLLLILI